MATILTQQTDNNFTQPVTDMDRETTPVSLERESRKDLVQLFKLLADDTRLQILNYLAQEEELNVRTLCNLLNQSQPSVSHHLALLKVSGLIGMRRDGKHNFYSLVPENIDKVRLMVDRTLPI
ncbi:MAG: ArsR family transcriptional regulator [Pirellulaceae bacterium]|jgi:ArsR family transcriptional regulator